MMNRYQRVRIFVKLNIITDTHSISYRGECEIKNKLKRALSNRGFGVKLKNLSKFIDQYIILLLLLDSAYIITYGPVERVQ